MESVRALRHPFGSDDDQQIGALEEFTEGELSNWLLVNAGDPETIDCEEIPSKIILRRILYNSESCDEIILSSIDPVFAGIEIKIGEGATAYAIGDVVDPVPMAKGVDAGIDAGDFLNVFETASNRS